MSTRRGNNPQVIQAIWESIKLLIHQKLLPSSDRIQRNLARVLGVNEFAAQNELKTAIKDNLIEVRKVILKSTGAEQDSYRFPSEITKFNDSSDWYCYKCHDADEVLCCQNCHRVFHQQCYVPSNQTTIICEFCEYIIHDYYYDINDLNQILKFVCGHLKAKMPPIICDRTILSKARMEPINEETLFLKKSYSSESEDKWRPDFLIKKHMDLTIMELKVDLNLYKNLSEFQADAHNILHNVVVYHGKESQIAKMAETMYSDCCYDMQEIRRCADCYRISNEKTDKNWYCIPCDPPHELVFAKQKGYPYWPAKVMQINDDIYDVRFFGGHHSRANIEKSFIKPINTPLDSLPAKKTVTWSKAHAELQQHLELLENFKPNNKFDSRKNMVCSNPYEILKDLRVNVERILPTNSQKSQSKERDSSPKSVSNNDNSVPCINSKEEEISDESLNLSQKSCANEIPQVDMVTSSCQESHNKNVQVQTDPVSPLTLSSGPKLSKKDRKNEKTVSPSIEKLKRELEIQKCNELAKLQEEHAKEIRQLERQFIDKQQRIISEVKKKQWCYNCESEAIYHCCWNTAYCSTDCQQLHWQREHKRVCRRKK